jgi:hypothetical protein
MQCLYCEKRLGLFARLGLFTWKRPFCSEQHAVAYQDQQSGMAMSRVLDPRFTGPVFADPVKDPSPFPGPGQKLPRA